MVSKKEKNLRVISKIVKEMVEKNRFLTESMAMGVINCPRLAEKYHDKVKQQIAERYGEETLNQINVTKESIKQALYRYQKTQIAHQANNHQDGYFTECNIKTNICYLIFKKTQPLMQQLSNIMINTIVDFTKGGIFNIVQGNFDISIVINQRYKQKFLQHLQPEFQPTKAIEDLVSLSFTYAHENYTEQPAVLYNILRYPAYMSINIYTILHNITDVSLIIHNNDLPKCYDALKELIQTQTTPN